MSTARILASDTIIEHGADGAVYARSPHVLGAYPGRITHCLEHWAGHAPNRTFLARRDAEGAWRGVTYAEALNRVRRIAQSLIDRRLSADRPVVILSGNSIEHGLLALAAMYAGVVYAPIAPSYCLLATEFTTLKALWQTLRPGLVFAAECERYERALAAVGDSGAEIVTCSTGSPPSTTPFAELEDRPATPSVDEFHARVGPDTVAKILFTSGSTGRPKGVINTQRMLCANQEMVRTVLPLLADDPPVLCDWLPWNHTFGGNHNFGIVLYNGGTLYIDDGKPTPEGFETTIANLQGCGDHRVFQRPAGIRPARAQAADGP